MLLGYMTVSIVRLPVTRRGPLRIVAFFQFIFTVAGVVTAYCAYMVLVEVKFPDPSIEENGMRGQVFGINSPHGFTFNAISFFNYSAVSITVVLISVSIRQNARSVRLTVVPA